MQALVLHDFLGDGEVPVLDVPHGHGLERRRLKAVDHLLGGLGGQTLEPSRRLGCFGHAPQCRVDLLRVGVVQNSIVALLAHHRLVRLGLIRPALLRFVARYAGQALHAYGLRTLVEQGALLVVVQTGRDILQLSVQRLPRLLGHAYRGTAETVVHAGTLGSVALQVDVQGVVVLGVRSEGFGVVFLFLHALGCDHHCGAEVCRALAKRRHGLGITPAESLHRGADVLHGRAKIDGSLVELLLVYGYLRHGAPLLLRRVVVAEANRASAGQESTASGQEGVGLAHAI